MSNTTTTCSQTRSTTFGRGGVTTETDRLRLRVAVERGADYGDALAERGIRVEVERRADVGDEGRGKTAAKHRNKHTSYSQRNTKQRVKRAELITGKL